MLKLLNVASLLALLFLSSSVPASSNDAPIICNREGFGYMRCVVRAPSLKIDEIHVNEGHCLVMLDEAISNYVTPFKNVLQNSDKPRAVQDTQQIFASTTYGMGDIIRFRYDGKRACEALKLQVATDKGTWNFFNF